MKTIIFYTSTHHGNTAKVAQTIGETLKAEMHDIEKEDVSRLDITKFDLIGLGSGIYGFSMSPKLFDLVEKLDLKGRKVFLFATTASMRNNTRDKMKAALMEKQASLVGDFISPGFIDWAFFKWFGGGLRKGHPDAADLENARKFAESLKK